MTASHLPWTQADLVAHKLFLTARTTITVEPGETPMEAVLRIDSRFVGRHTESRLVVDRKTGETREREKIQHGKKPYSKTYRFGRDAVTEHRVSPRTEDERKRGRQHWTKTEKTEHPIPDECESPLHTEGLFWLLATRAPRPGDEPLVRCAFTGDGFATLTISPVGTSREPLKFEQDGEIEREPEGTVELLELRLDGRALDSNAAEEIDFLGLEGEIGLVLDTQTGAPVRVTGKVSPLGTVVVELERLVP